MTTASDSFNLFIKLRYNSIFIKEDRVSLSAQPSYPLTTSTSLLYLKSTQSSLLPSKWVMFRGWKSDRAAVVTKIIAGTSIITSKRIFSIHLLLFQTMFGGQCVEVFNKGSAVIYRRSEEGTIVIICLHVMLTPMFVMIYWQSFVACSRKMQLFCRLTKNWMLNISVLF